MTAMNAMILNDSITLSMDTLVSINRDGKVVPSYFTQKFEYVPFAKSVVCGTGNLTILKKVFNMIHEVLAGEVDILVDLISSYLSNGINNGDVSLENNAGTLTVYVFGFDVNGQVKAYKMKSGNNFRSELIAGGEIGPKEIIKPNNSEIVSAIRPILSIENTEEQLKKIMRIQKSIEDASGVSNKEYVGIGGENYCLQFNRNSEMAAIKRIDTFDDYEEQYEYAYDHINDN